MVGKALFVKKLELNDVKKTEFKDEKNFFGSIKIKTGMERDYPNFTHTYRRPINRKEKTSPWSPRKMNHRILK